jgi:dolichyl-phosphate-mannose-protein mannosyltransferase
MRDRKRTASLAGGLFVLALGTTWAHVFLRGTPLYRYNFEWFLKLGPGEWGFYGIDLVTGGLAVFLLAYGLRPWLDRAIRASSFSNPRLLLGVSALAAAVAALIGLGLLRNQVVTDDEYVYLFQSRMLLLGRASLPPPPLPLFFTNTFIGMEAGRWFGQYPPGHPLALAPGVLLGFPRAIPVALVGLNVYLTGLLVRRVCGPGWGTAAALLLATSPLFLLTGATLLSHGTAYFALVLAAYGALRAGERRGRAWSLLCGTGVGFLFLTRPWTGLTLGLFPPLLLARTARARKDPGLVVPGLVASFLCGVLFLLYNHEQTGHALLTGYDAIRRTGGRIEFGFGPIISGVYEHTVMRGFRNLALLVVRFHFWSWGWPLAILPALFVARRGWTANDVDPILIRGAWWMLAVGFLAYVPYWSIGVNDTGPVKTYELLLPFTLVSILGLRAWAGRDGAGAPAAGVTASFLVALVFFWPIMIGHLDRLSAGVALPLRAIETGAERPAMVFVPDPGLGNGESWVFGRPNPRPDLSDPVLLVRDLGPADRDLLRLFPGRHGYQLQRVPGDVRLVPIDQ